MNWQEFLKPSVVPLGWCPGCGLNLLFQTTCQVLAELKLKKAVVVSGIGCTGRGAGYFNLDTVHCLHGRAIPVAVGIKRANPKLKVIVFSGDGDLLSIGGNHLLHAARRNDNLSVVCNVNEVFGMTGGQVSPTTRMGGLTMTTPEGNPFPPLNTQAILLGNPQYFFARTTPFWPQHLRECLLGSFRYQGFSFTEVLSPCLINFARKMGQGPAEVIEEIKKKYQIVKSKTKPLKDNQLGIVKK